MSNSSSHAPVTDNVAGFRSAGTPGLQLSQLYGAVGLLVPVSLCALLAAAWLQHSRPELPAEYTWLQPFNTLVAVCRRGNVPALVVSAFLLGVTTRPGFSVREWWGALWRRSFEQSQRLQLLVRALLGVVLMALDLFFLGPWTLEEANARHGLLDALAIGVGTFALCKPYPWRAVRAGLVYLLSSVLIFTAVCYWFTVMKALVFVGRTPRDAMIVQFEHALTGIQPHRWLAAWTSEHPAWLARFDWAYCWLFHHMAIVSAFLFGLRDQRQRTEYLSALAVCYLLGAPLYWLCPAAGPAYFDPAQFAFLRHYPLINVNWMQSVLYQNTLEINERQPTVLSTWSYIACMPSLHMAHETVMLFYARSSKIALALSLAFTSLTAVAVVALGWHYPTDIVGGVALAVFSLWFVRWQSSRLLPRLASE